MNRITWHGNKCGARAQAAPALGLHGADVSRARGSRAAAPRLWLVGVILAALAATASPVLAQDWPSKPVRVIYPWPPGGSIEMMIRLVTERLSRELGQQFIVENRAGASGTMGSGAGAKSRPDGYTLVISGLPSHVTEPVYSNDTPYDPMKDFTHIALLGGSPVALAVYPGLEAKTLREFVELSRTKADGIAFASAGTGTFVHLFGERFRQLSGGKLLHVPYKGLMLAAADLIAGHIPSAFTTLGQAGALYSSGKLRLLAVSSPARAATHPEVPTFAEAGYKDLVATTWFALSGPAGLPRPMVSRLNAEVRAALSQPEIYNRLVAGGIGTEPKDLDADAFTEFVRAEIVRWTPLVRSFRPGGSK